MGRIYKLLLLIVSLINIAISICILSLFFPIPIVTATIKNYLAFYPWLDNIFSGFCILICLCFSLFILFILFSPRKFGDLVIFKSKGKLFFSKQTIESTVKYSFADVIGINYSKVMVKINRMPEKTKIYVKLSLNDSSRLVELTQTIQDKIESTLKLSLGIAVEFINIKVVEFTTDHKTQNHIDEIKDSRVI